MSTSLSPEMRVQLDQLNFEWDLDESKLLEESASQKITPFGFCFAFHCLSIYGGVIKFGCTLRTPMHRMQQISAVLGGGQVHLVGVVACYSPAETQQRILERFASFPTFGRDKEFYSIRDLLDIDDFFTQLSQEAVGPDPSKRPTKRKSESFVQKKKPSEGGNEATVDISQLSYEELEARLVRSKARLNQLVDEDDFDEF